jgi:hypothetical protein
MKKTLSVIFSASLLQIGLLGCSMCDCIEPSIEPFYINNSGVTVNLIIDRDCENRKDRDCKHEIENNDTLCNYNISNNDSLYDYYNINTETCSSGHRWKINGVYGVGGCCEVSFINTKYFKMEFLGDQKTCLVFDEEIKKENDIRYLENYTNEYNIISYAHDVYISAYYYIIISDLMQQAKEEYCDE